MIVVLIDFVYLLNKWGRNTYLGMILRLLRLVIERFTPDYGALTNSFGL
jgi:hypothetical protein